jgi:hypothetical protein
MQFVPSEISIFGVFVSPYVPCGVLGLLMASTTARLLNRYRASRFLAYPPLFFVALVVLYGGLLSLFVFPG